MIGDKWERNTVYKIYIFQVTSSKNHGNHQHNTFQAKLESSFLKRDKSLSSDRTASGAKVHKSIVYLNPNATCLKTHYLREAGNRLSRYNKGKTKTDKDG